MWLSWHRLRRLLQAIASWRSNAAARTRGEALSLPWEEEHQREPGLLRLTEPEAVEVSMATGVYRASVQIVCRAASAQKRHGRCEGTA